jgi:hypothetical protein
MAPHHFDIVFARRADGPTPRFIRLLEQHTQARGLIFVHCQNHEQAEVVRQAVAHDTLTVGCLIDYMGRSFRNDTGLGAVVAAHGGLVVVDPLLVARFGDKATMHLALERAGVPLARTLIWGAGMPNRALLPRERGELGARIVCKPARGSGSSGVTLDCDGSAASIEAARSYDPDDDFLLQEFVVPELLDGRPAWFRVYYCFGHVSACWWHPDTHATLLVTPEEIAAYRLGGLERISRTIAAISGYTWFSSEVALVARPGRRCFVPIDYLNNKCYMLTHSEVGQHGIPDALAERVAWQIVDRAAAHVCAIFRSGRAGGPGPGT